MDAFGCRPGCGKVLLRSGHIAPLTADKPAKQKSRKPTGEDGGSREEEPEEDPIARLFARPFVRTRGMNPSTQQTIFVGPHLVRAEGPDMPPGLEPLGVALEWGIPDVLRARPSAAPGPIPSLAARQRAHAG